MLALLATTAVSQAKPEPSPLFGDHAVLQRGCPVPVWGEAEPGEVVRVTFDGNSTEATADEQGRWRVELPAMEAGESGDLVFTSDRGTVTSRDVLVGDVWLCGGQSNMERPVRLADDFEHVKATATHPQIRQFKVMPRATHKPRDEPKGMWMVCSPTTVEKFTAIGYFFARELYDESHVPQGLINCTKGGTRIGSWMSQEALSMDDSFDAIMQRWNETVAAYPQKMENYTRKMEAWKQAKAQAEKTGAPFKEAMPRKPTGGPGSSNMPSGLYNAMAQPVLGYAVCAIIWYQGEANARFPDEYNSLLRGLIRDWREQAANKDVPFVIVQLPPFGKDDTRWWPVLREAQAKAAQQMPDTFLVVTIDLSDGTDVHPTNKQAFADRVLRVIRAEIFEEDIPAYGPRILSARQDGETMLVQLESDENIVLMDSPDTWGAFEIAGKDHVFHPAQARLVDGKIHVSSSVVSEPLALRYAWRAGPHPILFSESGLPAAPFRTDSWTD